MKLSGNAEFAIDLWKEVNGVMGVSMTDHTATVLVTDSNVVLPQLFNEANRSQACITGVDIQEPDLESVFMQLTGRALRD